GARRQGRTGVLQEYRLVRGHLPGVPQQVRAARQARFAGRDLHLIGSLHRPASWAGDPPTQPRLRHVDADRVGEVLDAQPADRDLSEQRREYRQWLDDHESSSAGSSGRSSSLDRKSTRLNSSHVAISYAVFCLKKKKNKI